MWQVLAASDPGMEAVWLQDCRGSFASMIADKQRREAAEAKSQAAQSIAQPDELIDFVHLKVRGEIQTTCVRSPCAQDPHPGHLSSCAASLRHACLMQMSSMARQPFCVTLRVTAAAPRLTGTCSGSHPQSNAPCRKTGGLQQPRSLNTCLSQMLMASGQTDWPAECSTASEWHTLFLRADASRWGRGSRGGA